MFSIDTIVINKSPGEIRAALFDRDQLETFIVDRPDQRSQIDSIYYGRVNAVNTRLQAAFIDLGNGQSGYLPASDIVTNLPKQGRLISNMVKEGDAVMVQVTRDAVADKACKLSARVSLAGYYLVLTPDQPDVVLSRKIHKQQRSELKSLATGMRHDLHGCIVRSNAVNASPDAIRQDYNRLCDQWQQIEMQSKDGKPPKRIYTAPDPIERAIIKHLSPKLKTIICNDGRLLNCYQQLINALMITPVPECVLFHPSTPNFDQHLLDEQIDSILTDRVNLPSGGSLIFSETPALIAIDVNTGTDTQSPTAINIEACLELARHIRLRNLSGQVVIDFVAMEKSSDQQQVVKTMQKVLSHDPVKTFIAGFTKLGLFEMTRKRLGLSISEILCEYDHQPRFSVETRSINAIAEVLSHARSHPEKHYELYADQLVIDALRSNLSTLRQEAETILGAPVVLMPPVH